MTGKGISFCSVVAEKKIIFVGCGRDGNNFLSVVAEMGFIFVDCGRKGKASMAERFYYKCSVQAMYEFLYLIFSLSVHHPVVAGWVFLI